MSLLKNKVSPEASEPSSTAPKSLAIAYSVQKKNKVRPTTSSFMSSPAEGPAEAEPEYASLAEAILAKKTKKAAPEPTEDDPYDSLDDLDLFDDMDESEPMPEPAEDDVKLSLVDKIRAKLKAKSGL